jgi:hypothetical protein
VLGRRKTAPETLPDQRAQQPQGPGKNRPTPRRREVEAARKQPLVGAARTTAGKGGRGSSKAVRQAAREERMAARVKMMEGDERYLPARDKGPVRRFAREYVDARWNLGELLLPIMVLVLFVSFLGSALQTRYPAVYGGALAVTYALVLVAIVDAVLAAQRIKKAVKAKLGASADTHGLTMYAAVRAFQIRRTRIPRPTNKRGEFPG